MANAPDWTVWDVIVWKLWPEKWGGGRPYIQRYKDAWIQYNKMTIIAVAKKYMLPPELIAGVCWIEVGGDPSFIDAVAFQIRSFDWSGPGFTDRMTITKTGGWGHADWAALANKLQHDVSNINIVGRHLRQLLAHDNLGRSLPTLSKDEVRIVGARYNRGTSASLAEIRRHTSYGDLIVRFWLRLRGLLS